MDQADGQCADDSVSGRSQFLGTVHTCEIVQYQGEQHEENNDGEDDIVYALLRAEVETVGHRTQKNQGGTGDGGEHAAEYADQHDQPRGSETSPLYPISLHLRYSARCSLLSNAPQRLL